MANSNRLTELCKGIAEECISCNQCIEGCQLLQQIGEDIVDIAGRHPTLEEAYACCLCGLCEAVCPVSLSPKNMFAETRIKAVRNEDIDIHEYRYMFPDRKRNVMSVYRELSGVNYPEFMADQECPIAFFPGCTMLTYSSELTRALYEKLSQKYGTVTMITDCCGLPLSQLGLQVRFEDYIAKLQTKLHSLKVKEVAVACPNCFYQLRPALEDMGIQMKTIYHALEDISLGNNKVQHSPKVTIHDSCSDRFEGLFAEQVRNFLTAKGFEVIEMERNRRQTFCCGSGGQVTHFDPALADKLVMMRLEEAEKTGAEVLASYCVGCALNFARIPSPLNIKHVFNLLLDIEQDFTGVKRKAKQLFSGPQGERHWAQIMTDN